MLFSLVAGVFRWRGRTRGAGLTALLALVSLGALSACGGGADEADAGQAPAVSTASQHNGSEGVVAADQMPSIESTADGLPTDLQAQEAAASSVQAS